MSGDVGVCISNNFVQLCYGCRSEAEINETITHGHAGLHTATFACEGNLNPLQECWTNSNYYYKER